MTEHYFYDFIVLVVGIVIAAFISLIIQKEMKKREVNSIIENLKQALILEIEQNIKTIDEEKPEIKKDGDLEYIIFKSSLLTSAFESSVNSGNYLLLSRNHRNKLVVLYDMIDKSNYNGRKILDFGFVIPPSESRELFDKIRKTQLDKVVEKHKTIKESLELRLKELK